jgi:transcriptional regulator with XRE-family HTH domain
MDKKAQRRSGRPRADALDLHVGARLRERRTMLGLSQEQLAEAVGLTFQQIQKYERGINRMGASRLWSLARALDVPLDYFYGEGDSPRPVMPAADARELLDAYLLITDAMDRRRVLRLAKHLAQATPSAAPERPVGREL